MTDYELNKAIMDALGLWYDSKSMWESCKIIDYCNNWNDLMPLVIEHKININYDMLYPRWVSTKTETNGIDDFWEGVISVNENPQRALAECLLRVLEE